MKSFNLDLNKKSTFHLALERTWTTLRLAIEALRANEMLFPVMFEFEFECSEKQRKVKRTAFCTLNCQSVSQI